MEKSDQTISNVTWGIVGAAIGSTIGAILGIIAYNHQWLG